MPLKAPRLKDSRLLIRIATDPSEIATANKLVCEKYIGEGYWDDDQPFRQNCYMHSEMRVVFVIEISGEIVGTASIVKDSDSGLPLDKTHPDVLRTFRATGEYLAEVSALALDKTVIDQRNIILFLFKFIYQYSFYYCRVDRFVIATTARHAAFYKSAYCFEELGGGSCYRYVKAHVKPTVLTLPLLQAHEEYYLRYEHGQQVDSSESFYRFMLVNEHPNLKFPSKKLMQRSRAINWVEQARMRRFPLAV